MRNKTGNILMISGAVLLLAALSLFLWNENQARKAQNASQEAMGQVLLAIQAQQEAQPQGDGVFSAAAPATVPDSPQSPQETTAQTPEEDRDGMVVVERDGVSYVGYLTIPDQGLTLPVLWELKDDNLQIGPCRYAGSLRSENLVIGAHNYVQHFAKIWRLQPGALITFTDMEGVTHSYQVETVETLSPSAVDDLTRGTYPLTLFTCTYTGNQRTAVRCTEIQD